VFSWLAQNKEWLFSGVGATVLGVVFALMSRKRNAVQSEPHQIIVRVEESSKSTSVAPASIPLVHVERITPITPAEIHNAIKDVPPLQKASVKQRFVGLKVEWDTQLKSADEKAGVVRLYLGAADKTLFDIWCSVKYDDYRELGILPKGSLIRVYGEIEKADEWSVDLRNVELKYMEAKPA
jgi:hypothetical protein